MNVRMLRDFWFQILLAAAGAVSGLATTYAEDNPRRLAWTIAIILWASAALSYVWGDPVRGPFAKLLHPRSSDTFWLHSGVAVGFPVRQLKDGIDFSRAISLPGSPIELWIRRTWWSGWSYKVAVKSASGERVIQFSDKATERIPPGWDMNADEDAVEVVDYNGLPRLQIIQAGDYDVYLNTVLSGENQAMVFKDNRLEMKASNMLTRDDYPRRLFIEACLSNGTLHSSKPAPRKHAARSSRCPRFRTREVRTASSR